MSRRVEKARIGTVDNVVMMKIAICIEDLGEEDIRKKGLLKRRCRKIKG